jgi:hypothetical protein
VVVQGNDDGVVTTRSVRSSAAMSIFFVMLMGRCCFRFGLDVNIIVSFVEMEMLFCDLLGFRLTSPS